MSGYLTVTLVVGIGALAWVLWQRRHPRIRAVDAEELPSVAGQYPPPDDDFDTHASQALDVVAEHCCEWHNRNCEPPSELCCQDCTEYAHPRYHPPGVTCVAPDLSAGFDVIAEPDRRRAEHMNRTLRRAEGGDEQWLRSGVPATSAS